MAAASGIWSVLIEHAETSGSVAVLFSSRRRHTRCSRDWSSDVCSSDLDYSALAGSTNLAPPGQVTGIGSGTGGNPDLKPIRSTNYDMGLEWYFAKRSLLSGTLFYMDLQNYIGFGSQILTYQTYGAGLPPGGAPVQYNLTVPVNTKGRVQGVEDRKSVV